MAIRDDLNDLMKTQIQRFRDKMLSPEEEKEVEDDVTAFCIIEIRKFCGEDIFEEKNQELIDKGIRKARPQVNIKKLN